MLVEQCSTHTATNKSIVYGNTAVTNFACRCRHRRTSVCSAVSHRIRDSRSDSVHWHGRATVYSAASRLTSFGVHRCVCVCVRFERLCRLLLCFCPWAGNRVIVSCAQLQRRIYQQKHTIAVSCKTMEQQHCVCTYNNGIEPHRNCAAICTRIFFKRHCHFSHTGDRRWDDRKKLEYCYKWPNSSKIPLNSRNRRVNIERVAPTKTITT